VPLENSSHSFLRRSKNCLSDCPEAPGFSPGEANTTVEVKPSEKVLWPQSEVDDYGKYAAIGFEEHGQIMPPRDNPLIPKGDSPGGTA